MYNNFFWAEIAFSIFLFPCSSGGVYCNILCAQAWRSLLYPFHFQTRFISEVLPSTKLQNFFPFCYNIHYILHYPSCVHNQAVYNLTLPFHFSNYIFGLYHYIFLFFVIILRAFHLCWFCHTSTMSVPPSSSFSLIMCPTLRSLISSVHNIVWWTPVYPCG